MSKLSEAEERLSEHADAILNCVTKTEGTHESGGRFTSYDRDVDKPGYGLAEPYELARFVKGFLDPTPLTADWLRSVGFGFFVSEPESSGIELSNGYAQVSRGYRGQWLVNGCELEEDAWPETRGQLRTLCRALGIELQETRDG